jgi:hypothetical protein
MFRKKTDDLSLTAPPISRGGGDPKVKIYVLVFVVFGIPPVGVGKIKTNPSRKENGSHGQ